MLFAYLLVVCSFFSLWSNKRESPVQNIWWVKYVQNLNLAGVPLSWSYFNSLLILILDVVLASLFAVDTGIKDKKSDSFCCVLYLGYRAKRSISLVSNIIIISNWFWIGMLFITVIAATTLSVDIPETVFVRHSRQLRLFPRIFGFIWNIWELLLQLTKNAVLIKIFVKMLIPAA